MQISFLLITPILVHLLCLSLFERHDHTVLPIISEFKAFIVEPLNYLQLFLKLTYLVDPSTLAQYLLSFVVKVSPKL